ncbi:unnamed protein product [Rotaria sp. Silwood1]|nr:unnamed protein product [Rotaria sp. Silwood1]
MCDRFNRNSCQRDVQITIDPGYSGVAYTLGRIIVISAKWLRDNPQDTDVITHEGMHVVQGYPRYDPSCRGTSDHFRGTTCHSLGTSDHFRGTKYHSRGTADHFHSTKVPLWWYRGPFILHNWPFSLYR